MKRILKSSTLNQFIRFLSVGFFTTLINYLVFFVSRNYLSINLTASIVIGYSLGLLLGYSLNKTISFSSSIKNHIAAPVYIIINTFSIFLLIILTPAISSRYSIGNNLSYLIILVLTTFINFFGSKILAFQNKEW